MANRSEGDKSLTTHLRSVSKLVARMTMKDAM